jgi:hypothetical protein
MVTTILKNTGGAQYKTEIVGKAKGTLDVLSHFKKACMHKPYSEFLRASTLHECGDTMLAGLKNNLSLGIRIMSSDLACAF